VSADARRWPASRRSVLINLNRAAMQFWHQCLLDSPIALEFLASRGFSDPVAVARRYGLGYAPVWADGQRGFVQHVLRRSFPGTEGREDLVAALIAAGLARKWEDDDRIRDFFYGRLMFPIADRGSLPELWTEKGRVVAFGGRYVPRPGDEEDTEKGPPPKWLNTSDTPVFHKRAVLYGLSWADKAIRVDKRVAVLEGYLDVIQVAEAGFPAVVATLGTSLTEDHLKRLPPSTSARALRIFVASDDDEAGRKAAFRAAQIAFSQRPDAEVRIARPADGLDPDDLVRQRGGAAFMAMLDEASTPVSRIIADLPPASGALADLVREVRRLQGWISVQAHDRAADVHTVAAHLQARYGARFPVRTLESLLALGPSERQAA
jgi:DNA primase